MRIGNCVKKDEVYIIHQDCTHCSKTTSVTVTPQQLYNLRNAKGNIQDVLEDKTPAERETFLTGICGDCFKEIFSGCEEEEEEEEGEINE